MKKLLLVFISLSLFSCSHTPDPKPIATQSLAGAATGAGAGAIIGYKYSAATGPGAAIGAGFGAVMGAVNGLLSEQIQYKLKMLEEETNVERQRAYAHEIIKQQYERRLTLHPTRDIYPADIFFYGDETKLRPKTSFLLNEIAKLNKERLPWSRLAVVNYVVATDKDSQYAKHLSRRRSIVISDELTKLGIEPRRLVSRGVIVKEPVLVDPNDYPLRYSQAVEFIALDK